MIVVGLDPGLSGALAFVEASDGALVAAYDMPVIDGEVQPPVLTQLLLHHAPYAAVCIEQVSAMPKQGVSSTFKFGVAYGVAWACASRWRVERVRPAVWKRQMGLSADKEQSRAAAIARWPDSEELFRRKRDDGRAEAALLAVWCIEHRLRGIAA